MKSNNPVRILFYSAIIVLFAFTGCKKDKEDKDPTKTELLCKEWKISTIDGQSVSDYLGSDEVILKFDTDGDFKITFYEQGDTETIVGEWVWKDNESEINITLDDEPGKKIIFEVNKLTTTEFRFFDPDEDALFKCEPR